MSELDKFSSARDSHLEKLFGSMPAEIDVVVTLPSMGKFYTNKSPTVTISPIKFEDEKQITISSKNNINPVNYILSKCVKGLDVGSMLLMDKFYLLLRVREISYGETYPAIITCPHCKAESDVSINLTNLLVNGIPDDVGDPREIKLPKLQVAAKVKFPRVADEVYLDNATKVYDNLWRFVLSLDGNTDPAFISKAIPKMSIKDVKFILNNVLRSDLGLNPKFIFECDSCGAESQLEVPINENFFSVT
jgi:hypothetical protein